MPKPRPPHLQREVTRWGKVVWFVRVGKGPRVRIRGEYGSAEFMAEYQAAISGQQRQSKGTKSGSLAWLIERYRETPAWLHYSLATRRQRENIFKHVIETAGEQPYKQITEAVIVKGRDRRGATPHQARHFLDTMRGLFAWAKEAGLVSSDPAAAVKYPYLKSGEGFAIWTEDDVAAYEARWPLGTRERVWLAVLLYTGLRRGDAVRLGRQHVHSGVARIKTEKTNTRVTIRLLPPLVEALNAGPIGEMTYVCGANGRPLTKESFGNDFAEACRKAGIRKSAHGLRKLAATTMANNGATVAELNAIFGWTGSKMAAHYTQNADRERLSLGAVGKLMNETATSIPAPNDKVRASGEK